MSDEKKLVRPNASSESDQDEDELSEQIKTCEETFSPSFHKESQHSAEHISEENFTAGSSSEPELLPSSQSDDSSDHSDSSVPTESSQLKCSTCKRIKSQSLAVQDPEALQESLPGNQQRYTNGSDPFIRSETLQESLPDDSQQRSPNASRSFEQPDPLREPLFPDEIRSTDTPIPYHLLSPERRALLEQQRYDRFFEQCISFLQPEMVQESLSDAHQTSTDASGPFVQPDTLRESHSIAHQTSTDESGPFAQPEIVRESYSDAYQTSTGAFGPFVQTETLRGSHSRAHQTSTGASGPFGRPSSPQSRPRHQPEAEEFPLFYIFLVLFQLYVLIDPTYFHSISTLSGLAIPPMFFQGEYLPAAPIWFLVISGFWLAIFAILYIL